MTARHWSRIGSLMAEAGPQRRAGLQRATWRPAGRGSAGARLKAAPAVPRVRTRLLPLPDEDDELADSTSSLAQRRIDEASP
jgi:hypothetical protein